MAGDTYSFTIVPEEYYYEFYSAGPKGLVKKIVSYRLIQEVPIKLYNLGFGDWNNEMQDIDDKINTNNQDRQKVLTTVAKTALDFLDKHPGESYFLQAEAVARGWATGNLSNLFTTGIRRSFDALGISASATAYIQNAPDAQLPGTTAGNIRAIITQKYYAMNGFQGFEAWTEWRRTGYPDFIQTSAASTLGAGRMPLRFLYPNSEVTTNLNYPGTIPIYEPVWWDK